MIQSIPFLNKQWTVAHVERIEDATEKIRHIWLRPNKRIKFKPGQNISLYLPISDNEPERKRTYSIANIPNEQGLLEICISYVEGGRASEFLFKEIGEGTELKIRGPHGDFTLPQKINKDLVFICMGSAVAPARSMIQAIFKDGMPDRKVHLIFGARSKEGLLCGEEFMALAMRYGHFKYSFTLSREPDKLSSTKRKYVHDIYMSEYRQPRKDVLFYVSGRPSMIEETVENLQGLGYSSKQIKYDMNI
ncbi:MAG TPA: FAD-dependent oxidoreductase [Saprospiraceae bacterium]|nr:FAD-dependent oxidoreductase [Saprospiraceae bacterium]